MPQLVDTSEWPRCWRKHTRDSTGWVNDTTLKKGEELVQYTVCGKKPPMNAPMEVDT